MKHRNSHFAVGYWSRIRAGRRTPDQADIDPKALKRLLPNVFLLECRADGAFVYRLAGTSLCDRRGVELRGMNFLRQWDAESHPLLASLLRQSLRLRTPLCLTSVAATEDCRMIEIETVLMPITYGGEEPKRFLAVAQVLTDVSTFKGKTITFERLVSSALIQEGEARVQSETPPPPPSMPMPTLRLHPKAPHLRLVVSQNRVARDAETAERLMNDPLRIDAGEAMRKLLSLCGIDSETRSA